MQVSGVVNLSARFMSAAMKKKEYEGFKHHLPDGSTLHIGKEIIAEPYPLTA
jgi:hypothetical protein